MSRTKKRDRQYAGSYNRPGNSGKTFPITFKSDVFKNEPVIPIKPKPSMGKRLLNYIKSLFK